MRECSKRCYIHQIPCTESECRLHLDYEEDLNCTDIAVYKHGEMTLQQISAELRPELCRYRCESKADS